MSDVAGKIRVNDCEWADLEKADVVHNARTDISDCIYMAMRILKIKHVDRERFYVPFQ